LEHVLDGERDCFVAVTDPGAVVVGVATMQIKPIRGNGVGSCAVVPEARGQGVEVRLLRTSEAYLVEHWQEMLPPEATIWCDHLIHDSAKAMQAMLHAEGYTLSHTLYELRMDLNATWPHVDPPEGIVVRPFDPDRRARAIYELEQEVQVEHGWLDSPIPFEAWRAGNTEHPLFDPTLYIVAWDGDRVVGYGSSWTGDPRQPDRGQIEWVNVRKSHRKRGIGRLIMLRLFAALQARGCDFVETRTGTDNPHHTPELAQRIGMQITGAEHWFKKVLYSPF
jgi:ribosomal protein S18 acetylase RimI-like enzyme